MWTFPKRHSIFSCINAEVLEVIANSVTEEVEEHERRFTSYALFCFRHYYCFILFFAIQRFQILSVSKMDWKWYFCLLINFLLHTCHLQESTLRISSRLKYIRDMLFKFSRFLTSFILKLRIFNHFRWSKKAGNYIFVL